MLLCYGRYPLSGILITLLSCRPIAWYLTLPLCLCFTSGVLFIAVFLVSACVYSPRLPLLGKEGLLAPSLTREPGGAYVSFVCACASPQSPLYGREGLPFTLPGTGGRLFASFMFIIIVVWPCPTGPCQGGGEEPLPSPRARLDRAA